LRIFEFNFWVLLDFQSFFGIVGFDWRLYRVELKGKRRWGSIEIDVSVFLGLIFARGY